MMFTAAGWKPIPRLFQRRPAGIASRSANGRSAQGGHQQGQPEHACRQQEPPGRAGDPRPARANSGGQGRRRWVASELERPPWPAPGTGRPRRGRTAGDPSLRGGHEGQAAARRGVCGSGDRCTGSHVQVQRQRPVPAAASGVLARFARPVTLAFQFLPRRQAARQPSPSPAFLPVPPEVFQEGAGRASSAGRGSSSMAGLELVSCSAACLRRILRSFLPAAMVPIRDLSVDLSVRRLFSSVGSDTASFPSRDIHARRRTGHLPVLAAVFEVEGRVSIRSFGRQPSAPLIA